jgi:hypothetical protein
MAHPVALGSNQEMHVPATVTQEVAGSSPVVPANLFNNLSSRKQLKLWLMSTWAAIGRVEPWSRPSPSLGGFKPVGLGPPA